MEAPRVNSSGSDLDQLIAGHHHPVPTAEVIDCDTVRAPSAVAAPQDVEKILRIYAREFTAFDANRCIHNAIRTTMDLLPSKSGISEFKALGISRATAARHWSYARAWLFERLTDGTNELADSSRF